MNHKPLVLTEERGRIFIVTINRIESRNAVDGATANDLREAFKTYEARDDLKVAVLTGSGGTFCAGADLAGQAIAKSSDPEPDGKVDDYFNGAMRAIYNSSVPTVARINGAAAGGGFGLALACDIAVAAKSSFFVATFGPRLGIVPDLGTTWNLPHKAGRARALGLAMLGDRISAEQAEAWGLIWKAVEDDQLDDEVEQITSKLARTSADAMTRIRSVTDAALSNNFSDQLDLEMEHQAVLIPKNMTEGARAFMEKRESKFPGRN